MLSRRPITLRACSPNLSSRALDKETLSYLRACSPNLSSRVFLPVREAKRSEQSCSTAIFLRAARQDPLLSIYIVYLLSVS